MIPIMILIAIAIGLCLVILTATHIVLPQFRLTILRFLLRPPIIITIA